MELAFLCLAARSFGIRRGNRVMDTYTSNPYFFLACTPACWCAAYSLSSVGKFRNGTQLFPLAA